MIVEAEKHPPNCPLQWGAQEAGGEVRLECGGLRTGTPMLGRGGRPSSAVRLMFPSSHPVVTCSPLPDTPQTHQKPFYQLLGCPWSWQVNPQVIQAEPVCSPMPLCRRQPGRAEVGSQVSAHRHRPGPLCSVHRRPPPKRASPAEGPLPRLLYPLRGRSPAVPQGPGSERRRGLVKTDGVGWGRLPSRRLARPLGLDARKSAAPAMLF